MLPATPRRPTTRTVRPGRRHTPTPTRLAGTAPAKLYLVSAKGKGLASTLSVHRRGYEAVKWTQRQIASASGVSVSTISTLFDGKRKGYYGTVKLIASALDVTVDELYAFLMSRRAGRTERERQRRVASRRAVA